jgi:hypothetical protein
MGLIRNYIDRITQTEVACSFCGRAKDEAPRFISGPGVHICSWCVELCEEILSENWRGIDESAATSDPTAQMRLVKNAGAVERVFGRWPSFHDAEVMSLRLQRNGSDAPSLESRVRVLDTPSAIDREQEKIDSYLVTLRFTNVDLKTLRGFNEQNVLFDLVIEELSPPGNDGRPLAVQFDASYGLSAVLECSEVWVVDVRPFELPSLIDGPSPSRELLDGEQQE